MGIVIEKNCILQHTGGPTLATHFPPRLRRELKTIVNRRLYEYENAHSKPNGMAMAKPKPIEVLFDLLDVNA